MSKGAADLDRVQGIGTAFMSSRQNSRHGEFVRDERPRLEMVPLTRYELGVTATKCGRLPPNMIGASMRAFFEGDDSIVSLVTLTSIRSYRKSNANQFLSYGRSNALLRGSLL